MGRASYGPARPGPSGAVELALDWTAPAGTLFRAYLADVRALEVADAEDRAKLAMSGRAIVLDAATRRRFRLLTDPPVKAGPGPGDVTGAHPSLSDLPGLFSDPSLPVPAVFVPAQVPAISQDVASGGSPRPAWRGDAVGRPPCTSFGSVGSDVG